MRPMSLYEAGKSSGQVSLHELCNGKLTPLMTGEVQLTDLIDFIIRGGWPANQDVSLKRAAYLPKEYIEAVISDDIFRIDDVKRDSKKMELLLKSLAP